MCMSIAPCGLQTQVSTGNRPPAPPSRPLADARGAGGARVPCGAGEIDAPVTAGPRSLVTRRRLLENLPRHRDLGGPTLVAIARPVDRTLHANADLKARN